MSNAPKGAPATAALAALRTEHPLPTQTLAAGFVGIVAAQQAVPVQRFSPSAAGTALLLEGKSISFSAGSSRTKWKGRWNIHVCRPRNGITVELFLNSTPDGGTRLFCSPHAFSDTL